MSDKAGMVAMGLRPLEVGCLLMRTFAEMAFERGCVHADPHPGNILVRPQPAGSQGGDTLLPSSEDITVVMQSLRVVSRLP